MLTDEAALLFRPDPAPLSKCKGCDPSGKGTSHFPTTTQPLVEMSLATKRKCAQFP
jgi:hypothetical protein